MDINTPGMNGILATREIKKLLPRTHVLVLSMSTDDNDVARALKAGASGYLLKDSAIDELVSAIHGVMRGETPNHSFRRSLTCSSALRTATLASSMNRAMSSGTGTLSRFLSVATSYLGLTSFSAMATTSRRQRGHPHKLSSSSIISMA